MCLAKFATAASSDYYVRVKLDSYIFYAQKVSDHDNDFSNPALERVVQATNFSLTTQSMQKKGLECIVAYVFLDRGVAFQRTVDAGGWRFSALSQQINDNERYLLCGVLKIVILNWEA